LAISALWAPDLWGSVRRQVESSEAEAQASAATLQALRLTIQTTLAQSYFQLRILDAQKKLLNDTTVIYEKTVKLTKSRYEAGMISNADVIQAETQLQSTQAQTINLGVQRAQLEHAIAILIGKSPADLSIAVAPLNTNLPAIPLSLPSQLLERRPDIAEAERQAAAANAQIGVAKAAYFPNLNLAASNGQQSPLLSTLLSQGARYWELGPAALVLPLFDGGFRAAQMQQSIAAYDASVATYREAVLLGFQQVEDNLAALRILEQETFVQNQVVASAHKALKLTNTQYQSGAINYLNVMVNQVIVLTNEKKLIDLQGQRLNATVLLAQALGGGWNTAMLPTQDEAGGEFKWQQFLPVPIN
jgi:NodT family efflux transporter outer membrane factor (OMF) lipoprotein